nr:MFS transporter [Legionella nautarum]
MANQFSLNNQEIGLVLGTFGLGYVITTFLGGIAADKFGAKRTLAISILFWSVASLITGIATGLFMLILSRIILGIAEGPNFPALTRAIGDWLSETERNRALALALIAVPVSLALSGPIVSQLILHLSWRGAYYFLALLAILWLPLWGWLFKDNPKDSPYVNQAELGYLNEQTITNAHAPSKVTWKFLFFNKTLALNNWAFFVFGYYLFFFMTWLPRYLKLKYHLDLTQIGLYSIAPWLLGAIMMWGLGTLCDYIFKKTSSLRLSRSYPIFISQLFAALCIIPILSTDNIFVALIFISLAVGFVLSANASYYAVNIDIAKEWAGSALGIMDAIFAIAGFLSPTITGVLISLAGRFEAAFLLLVLLGLSSAILTFIFHNRESQNSYTKRISNEI